MCDLDHAKVKSDCLQDTSHAMYDTIRAAGLRYICCINESITFDNVSCYSVKKGKRYFEIYQS